MIMSERKAGWYWVETTEGWEAACWTGRAWMVAGADDSVLDGEMHKIGPRIPTPDDLNENHSYSEVMTDRGLAEVLSQTMSGELTVKLGNGDVENYMISEVERIP